MMWESRGIRGHGDMPPVAGNFSGILLVCGSGRTLWSDLERAPAGEIMLVNDAAWMLDRPAVHLTSLHAELLPWWAGYRKAKRIETHLHLHTSNRRHRLGAQPSLVNRWDLENGACYSGIFGAAVGLALGYSQVILCGVPQTGDGYVWSPPGKASTHDDKNLFTELRWWADNRFKGRVRSLSGKTRDVLGEPA